MFTHSRRVSRAQNGQNQTTGDYLLQHLQKGPTQQYSQEYTIKSRSPNNITPNHYQLGSNTITPSNGNAASNLKVKNALTAQRGKSSRRSNNLLSIQNRLSHLKDRVIGGGTEASNNGKFIQSPME